MKPKKISIVGGGLAGLACAYELLKKGSFEVNVLEALSALGGRLQSRIVHGHSVDFGGFLIYPWYKQCHALIRALGLADALAKTPSSDVYYVLRSGDAPLKMQDIPFSTLEGVKIWSKCFFKLFPEIDVAQPNLDRFCHQTIADYLRGALGTQKHAGLYETYFDTVSQGYCYGPVDRTKACFMAPIVRQTTLHGDIRSTSFFPNGSSVLIDRLSKEIVRLGGHLHLNSPVTGVKGLTLQTPRGDHPSDALVFAQTASADLHRQILPKVAFGCDYTHFLTAVVELDATPLPTALGMWGAIFHAPERTRGQQILSAVNLAALYGPDLQNCMMLNVVLRDELVNSLNHRGIEKNVLDELLALFPAGKKGRILERVYWDKAMPVAQERFVKAIRKRQGKDGTYFAGDYLGAPSIETAISTGLSAARAVLSDL